MPKEIYITELDLKKLKKLIDTVEKKGQTLDPYLKSLKGELEKAIVVDPREVPANAITMRSQVLLQLDQEEITVSLVYPDEADWSAGKLSVLSPIGTAILGYREDDLVEWAVPSGIAQILIKKLLYQPEAAGDYHM